VTIQLLIRSVLSEFCGKLRRAKWTRNILVFDANATEGGLEVELLTADQ
jgi:hypothetical protein